MSSTKKIGDFYENKAATYYAAQGATIVDRNYRYQKGEIDLIATQNNTLILIEVKFRRSTRFGNPESWVSSGQENRILETTDYYIEDHNWKGEVRFDIVAFTPNEMKVFKDVF